MKFNFLPPEKHQTTNYEGALAWQTGPAFKLYAAVVTTSLNHKL